MYPEGTKVRSLYKGKKKISIVDKIILTGSGLLRYKNTPPEWYKNMHSD